MKTIRTFIGWVADHPIRFIVWFILACISGGLFGYYDIPWSLFLVFTAVFATACYLDFKAKPTKPFLALLCLSLAFPSTADEPDPHFEPAGMAGVAVVVVVVGGVTVYLLVKTCQRVFPKTPAPSTNEPPYIRGTSGPDCAGSWCYAGFPSCYTPQDDGPPLPQVTMELSGVIQQLDDGTPFFNLTASRRTTREEESQDITAFQMDLMRHGIAMGEIGSMLFGRNGRPAYEQETPIRFSQEDAKHVVTVNFNSDLSPSVPMAIQRSFDLKTWSDYGFVSMPVGQQFKFIDTTVQKSVFYRIQPRP